MKKKYFIRVRFMLLSAVIELYITVYRTLFNSE